MYSPGQQFDLERMTNQKWIEFFTHLIDNDLISVREVHGRTTWCIECDLINEPDDFIDAAYDWVLANRSVIVALEQYVRKVKELQSDLSIAFRILPNIDKQTGQTHNDKEQSKRYNETLFCGSKEPRVSRTHPTQPLYEEYDNMPSVNTDNL